MPVKALRRRFGADYKARILREADQATASGQLGALLRREGLYSSHLSAWRKQLDAASLEALAPKRRGRTAAPHSPLVEENKRLTRQAATQGHDPESGLVVGHHEAPRAQEMDLYPPLRRDRHLQPIGRRLDARPS